jgi:hypothetical protein
MSLKGTTSFTDTSRTGRRESVFIDNQLVLIIPDDDVDEEERVDCISQIVTNASLPPSIDGGISNNYCHPPSSSGRNHTSTMEVVVNPKGSASASVRNHTNTNYSASATTDSLIIIIPPPDDDDDGDNTDTNNITTIPPPPSSTTADILPLNTAAPTGRDSRSISGGGGNDGDEMMEVYSYPMVTATADAVVTGAPATTKAPILHYKESLLIEAPSDDDEKEGNCSSDLMEIDGNHLLNIYLSAY